MNEALIQFKDVHKNFGPLAVLNGIDLTIQQGQVTTVIGKSGEGKSVLLKHIIGLMKPDSGEILFRGRPFASFSSKERKKLKRKFSYMFQTNALFDSMTCALNVALPLKEVT